MAMNALYAEIDRKVELVRAHFSAKPEYIEPFYDRMLFSWIYHDTALEGVALSYHELNSAIDDDIISDVSLIPAYEEIQNYKIAIQFIRSSLDAKRKPSLSLEYLKKLHQILSVESNPPRQSKTAPKIQPGQYRKDNPLHRLYYHEISSPEKIPYQMRKLLQWIPSAEAKVLHPIKRAALTHYKLISIFPWPKHSGKVARLLMNASLLRSQFLPAIIHGADRQRYYETLRQSSEALVELVGESQREMLNSALIFCQEMDKQNIRAAS